MDQVNTFLGWLAVAAALAGASTPMTMALVQLAGKFVQGQVQLAAAAVIGGVFGVLGFLGFWGVPADFYTGFQMLIFIAMMVGIPVGTYEAIKHASQKGADAALDE